MTSKKPLITIAIPVLNEEDSIPGLYERLSMTAEKMADRCDVEFLFSDNHSQDETWKLLSEYAEKDPRIRAIRFSKNFGFQRSILANYLHANGDAVMQIDADLQDPPEMLEDFFQYWQNGYQVVYGVRKKRQESRILLHFRRLGYWAIDRLSDHPIPRDAGDFRLIDKRVVSALTSMKTATPYLRGMIADLGFKQIGIPYDRSARKHGKSKFNILGLLRLGLSAVFNHSTVPLRLASFVGAIILVVSMAGAMYYFFLRLLHPDLPQGFASIVILLLFGIGLNAFLLGIIGEYLLRIYLVVRADPVAIVEESLNLEEEELKL
jgi:dolichol-phosphate mannosyltransferase